MFLSKNVPTTKPLRQSFLHSQLAKGTLSDILKQCGLSLEEFLNLL
jgi:hypothetical protein